MTTIQQHIQLTQQQRQSHIDLSTPCQPSVLTRNSKLGKVGDYTTPTMGKINSKKSLLDFHQIEDFGGRQINVCHLCQNNSQAPNGFVCTNAKHLYFGTASENQNDLDPNGNPTGGKAPASQKTKEACAQIAKEAMKNGNHANQQTHYCPRCNRTLVGPRGQNHIEHGTKSCPRH